MRVLILGGGGTLGAFSAGAIRALDEAGWAPDAFISSSAGGINLLRWMAAGPHAPAEFWRGLRWPALLAEALRDNPLDGGVLGEHRLYSRVEAGVDFAALLADPRPLLFLVVDMETGRVHLRGNRTETSAEALRVVSRAAWALPPLLPPVRLGERLYADGGLLHNAPLDRAAALGATEIVYLCNVPVVPREGYDRPWTLPASARYWEIFLRRAANVGFADAEVVEGLWRGVPFLTVAPPARRGLHSMVTALTPTRAHLERLTALGYAEASSAVAAWRALRTAPALPAGDGASGRVMPLA